MVGLLPLPALGPGPTPPPASVLRESLPAPGLKGQGTGRFALKLQGRSLAPPPTQEGSWEGQEESGFRRGNDAIHTPTVPTALTLQMVSSSQKSFMGDIINFPI